MLTVEDWAEVRRLYRAEGMPVKAIARHDRARQNLDRHPNYILAAFMAPGT